MSPNIAAQSAFGWGSAVCRAFASTSSMHLRPQTAACTDPMHAAQQNAKRRQEGATSTARRVALMATDKRKRHSVHWLPCTDFTCQ